MSRAPTNCFITHLDVRWSDQDINGHVNNAQAITLMEEARVRAGMKWAGNVPSTRTPRVVRTMNAVFDDELTHGEVIAHVWISRIGNTSYQVSHELVQRDVPCVYGETVIVILDPETRRPTPITPELRERLQDFHSPIN